MRHLLIQKLMVRPVQIVLIILLLNVFSLPAQTKRKKVQQAPSKAHPCLMLTPASVEEIRASLGLFPLFDSSFNAIKRNTIEQIQVIDVPVPKDAGGGYTHERHKLNAQLIYQAGILFQVTGEERFAVFIRDMLMAYGKMYPSLPIHPKKKEQSPGRLFWQDLNENVWLVYAIQGYDCVYNWLGEKDRKFIEENVFLPVSSFLSDGSPETFNLIHNHGTWAVTAVGMTGYVLGRQDLVEKSLRGLNHDGKGGFLAQLDELFSPSGYYTEGPYYQRYALMPFVLYAQVIQNNEPERNILYYRNSILKNAVEAALQLTYVHGEFFPLNDALKEKTWLSPELVYSVDIVYSNMGRNPQLLDVAKRQGRVVVSKEGLEVARDIHKGIAKPFVWKSMSFSDGARGNEGGVGILRSGKPDVHTCLVFEYAAQGMGHGHFDRLGMMMYDNGYEILQDYGASRFLNIEAKYGGHYLKENNTWAKQTIAHNTLVVDQTSQFKGKYEDAQKTHASEHFYDNSNPAFQIMSGVESNAYPGVSFTRTMAMLEDGVFSSPVILDIVDVRASGNHTYDLPFHYQGHFIHTTFDYIPYVEQRSPLGKSHGYQHLWLEGESKALNGQAKFTWLKDNRFYTLSTLAGEHAKILFARIGANDPNFNLRNDPAMIIRQNAADDHTFFSIIEPHGMFNATDEKTSGASSRVTHLEVAGKNVDGLVVRFSAGDKTWQLAISAGKGDSDKRHSVQTKYGDVEWTGYYELQEINK